MPPPDHDNDPDFGALDIGSAAPVGQDPREPLNEVRSVSRYGTNSTWWWFHDAVVHPITGTIGLFGRFVRSPRIMALAHHLHNVSAPSNDAWADYAEAACRAGHNETAANPMGRMTPDEQSWVRAKYKEVVGKECNIEPSVAAEQLKRSGVKVWDGQAMGQPPPASNAERTNAAEERLNRILAAFDSLGQHALHQIRNDLIASGKIRPEDWPN